MSRTITAMFDSRSDAQAGQQRLLDANIDAENVRILDQSSSDDRTGSYSTQQEPGIWASIKNAFLPDGDRHAYEEGIRRGGFLLTADVDDDEADLAVAALEDANSIDLDERSGEWRSQGWDYPAMAGGGTAGAMAARADTAPVGTTGGTEERLQVVEEQLVVSKREVDRGGVRVRSYVTEKPVHEQVRLRQENVNIERRPVDRASGDGEDPFQERTIEMTETSEESVVGKTTRVVEEIVVRKTADERVEDINETVRRTDVDVENLSGNQTSSMPGRAMGTAGDTTSTVGNTAAGLGKEALGNVKQGLGSLTGNESLQRSGEAQERAGEAQQGKRPD